MSLLIADLAPHPDQSKYFRKYGEYEYQALKADISTNGLRSAIDVLPPKNAAGLAPYTIIAGHTRCKILIELGNDKTDANVRYDLANAKREIIDEMFIVDNVARRQQDRLGQARAAKSSTRSNVSKKDVRFLETNSNMKSFETASEQSSGCPAETFSAT